MDQMKTGMLIRMLRQRRQMTQLQLAERIGVSDKAVSKWERGRGGTGHLPPPGTVGSPGGGYQSPPPGGFGGK